jgi:hypothetical protein
MPLVRFPSSTEGTSMTRDRTEEPRCATCGCVLPMVGAICHACDVEAHFSTVQRTAPPILTPLRERVLRRRSAHRAS